MKCENAYTPAVAKSLEYFKNGFSCSESVFRAFNEVYNLNFPEQFYKISTAFGAGLGEAKCCCGAVTGSVLVLSLIAGRNTNNESRTPAFTLANELHNKFKEKNKAICCRILTKSVKWESAERKTLCEKYVTNAAQITDDLIKRKLKELLPDIDSIINN